ncbi:unnamed protein product [Cylindrotheca closterium]|uniref:Transmembrane protein n=1 Tax=Cylindrotheca closterium TaxID=2856 RepID=A0AAD2JPX7_9STRA|nr:unnamed protein product [Cylindrotheca closterium]
MYFAMAIDDLHAQHAMHDFYSTNAGGGNHNGNGNGNGNNNGGVPKLVSESTQQWMLILLVVVSFALMGYVFTLVQEQERKEQKNK